MTDDTELLARLLKARYDFAAAVIDHHKSGCDNDTLLDRMSDCERAYLDAMITYATPGLTAAFARQEWEIVQLRELLAMPVEGEA